MTCVADLISYLQTLPPETEVKVLNAFYTSWSTCVEFSDIDISTMSENVEYHESTNTLYLGSE